MAQPPLGRAPLFAGPAWNSDETVKDVWERWFNGITSSVKDLIDNASSPLGLLTPTKSLTIEDVIITVLGVLGVAGNSRVNVSEISDKIETQCLTQQNKARETDELTRGDLARSFKKNTEIDDLVRIGLMAQRTLRPTPSQFVVCLQAAAVALIPTLPANTFIFVSDYAHTLFWDGVSSVFADEGSDYYALGQRASGSVGWHAVDGTANVSYLQADGSLGTRTLENVAAVKAMLAAGSGADVLIAPTAPVVSGHTDTGNAVFAVAPTAAGNAVIGNDSGAGTIVGAGVGSTVASHPHNHADAGHTHLYQPTDTGHQHNVTGVSVTTGEPENFYSILWYRQ